MLLLDVFAKLGEPSNYCGVCFATLASWKHCLLMIVWIEINVFLWKHRLLVWTQIHFYFVTSKACLIDEQRSILELICPRHHSFDGDFFNGRRRLKNGVRWLTSVENAEKSCGLRAHNRAFAFLRRDSAELHKTRADHTQPAESPLQTIFSWKAVPCMCCHDGRLTRLRFFTWSLKKSLPCQSSLWDVMKIFHNVP